MWQAEDRDRAGKRDRERERKREREGGREGHLMHFVGLSDLCVLCVGLCVCVWLWLFVLVFSSAVVSLTGLHRSLCWLFSSPPLLHLLPTCHPPEEDPLQPMTSDETVSVGGTVTLTCRVSETDNSSLQWSNTAQQTLFFGEKRGRMNGGGGRGWANSEQREKYQSECD